MVAQSGASGIGLLRTEFLFMNRDTVPSEDEQAAIYRSVVETMAGDPVTIRVLDWGGEKEIEALVAAGLVPEIMDANPALGLRGIRLLLRQRTPVRGAAHRHPARRQCRPGPRHAADGDQRRRAAGRARDLSRASPKRCARAARSCPTKLPPLGIMVETPGAALSSDALAAEAEFFAIGTNDLCMYTLAVDRGELDVAHLYDPLHPAMLRLIQFTAEAAQPASHPGLRLRRDRRPTRASRRMLLGLGVRSFSMNAAAVPRVKQAIRSTTIDDCQRLTWQVMKQSDPIRTRELLEQFGR